MKLLPWLMWCAVAGAAEPVKLPLDVGELKTRDGKVLQAARIVGHDAVGVKVVHAGGTARVAFERLPKDLADRFPRDRDAAKEQLEKEAKQEAAHDRTVDQAVKRQAADEGEEEEEESGETTLEGKPELKGDPAVKIAQLEAYIGRLQAGISKARDTARRARELAAKYRSRAGTSVTRYNSAGQIVSSDVVVNRSRLKRADFQERRAGREEDKIAKAELLIADAKSQIAELEKLIED